MSATRIRIRKGDDMHCHLRTGLVMRAVTDFTAEQFKRAVVMPNTTPPILVAEDVEEYRWHINSCRLGGFEPLMTIQITGETSPRIIAEAKKAGAIAGKVYPQGVTTNSQNGVSNFKAIYPALEKMQELGMPVLFHGEDPWEKAICLHREKMFLPTLYDIATDFPKLKIVLEHITTEDAFRMVTMLDNVAATITAHHLVLTLDDIVGGMIQPHNFCKPIAKFPEDREALLRAATSGSPKFFFGSDSAPHVRDDKECSQGCAGVFSAPVALALLAQIFEERNALDKMENFVSRFGADFYGLPQNTQTIGLSKETWTVPEFYSVRNGLDDIVPFMAGRQLPWRVS